MTKQHKWHKEIKAWADGAKIEFRNLGSIDNGEWRYMENPDWYVYLGYEYRIKPQPKEPQYVNSYGWLKNENIKFHKEHGPYLGKIKLEVDDD